MTRYMMLIRFWFTAIRFRFETLVTLSELNEHFVEEDSDEWLFNLKKFIQKKPFAWKMLKPSLESYCSVEIDAVPECRANSLFQEREGVRFLTGRHFDQFLVSKPSQGGLYYCHSLNKPMTWRDIALKVTGLDNWVGDFKLKRALIEGGHCIELAQIDLQCRKNKSCSEESELSKDGFTHTFYFLNIGLGQVVIALVSWRTPDKHWWVRTDSLDVLVEWTNARIVSRNETLDL